MSMENVKSIGYVTSAQSCISLAQAKQVTSSTLTKDDARKARKAGKVETVKGDTCKAKAKSKPMTITQKIAKAKHEASKAQEALAKALKMETLLNDKGYQSMIALQSNLKDTMIRGRDFMKLYESGSIEYLKARAIYTTARAELLKVDLQVANLEKNAMTGSKIKRTEADKEPAMSTVAKERAHNGYSEINTKKDLK